MANDAKTTGTAGTDPTTAAAVPTSQATEPNLPVLRFGLRQLFWFLTVACLVLAAVVAAPTPGAAPLAVLLAVLVVAFHVVGTTLGSRLRQHADERIAWQAGRNAVAGSAPKVLAPPTTRSSWHERGQALRGRWWLVAAGATIGGLAGVMLFSNAGTSPPTPLGIAFGALSMAVVGGWFAFLGCSFWVMLRRGWREAVAEQRKDEARRHAKR